MGTYSAGYTLAGLYLSEQECDKRNRRIIDAILFEKLMKDWERDRYERFHEESKHETYRDLMWTAARRSIIEYYSNQEECFPWILQLKSV